ncbi:hypothetical protein RhiirC2_797564, partial [Rhizophagus irregularis]
YRANWIDGNIINWNDDNQNWKRKGQIVIVELKRLYNAKNITLQFIDEVDKPYGITQDPETENYLIVLDNKCKKCNYVCYTKYLQHNFENWTSGSNDIDKFIQNSQLLAHSYGVKKVLEWIPYNRLYNIKCIAEDVYGANWADGNIINWNIYNQDWKRKGQNMIVQLKGLNVPKNITLEFIDKIEMDYIFYGITQNPETKSYIMVVNNKCKKCNFVCYAIHFQQNFENWTSGDKCIDKFIQDSQLSAHDDVTIVLEWIPYDKFYNIRYIAKDMYRANWIDGNIINWDNNNQNWKRQNQNIFATLKRLNDPKYIILGLENEINKHYGITQNPETKDYMMVLADKCKKCNFINKPYGITQNPETKNYMMVLVDKCNKCNLVCHAMHFQQNFGNWTSGNNDIDKFIQYSQLSAHDDCERVLEWLPYNKFYNIRYIMKDMYRANWIDGNIINWNNNNQNWKRKGQSMFATLKRLNNPKYIILELANEINKPYGITQNPETKDYMMVLADKCKKCNLMCYAILFRQNFKNWTSGNNGIDKFIQDTQLSDHYNKGKALEWIPYGKFYNIKYVAEDIYRANWIDGNIILWNAINQNWVRENQNMIVELKKLNNLESIKTELAYEISKPYGITQNQESKDYMMVLTNQCKKCNLVCYVLHSQQNFKNWTSGNNDIDKFIQDSQLSAHDDVKKALEWIPYDKFYNIKYVAKDIYRANWIDGNIILWNAIIQN